jgi:hypothetical protein
VPEIYRAWRAYLRARPERQGPTPLWSAAEQRRWPQYDLTAVIAYQGFPATVVDIRPTRPGASDEFVVRTLFATASGRTRDVRPLALTRVYAVREEGHWVFASALPRLTRDWRRESVGPISYVLEPGHRFDRRRAERALRFADSVAAAFRLPRIAPLTYYVTDTPEAMYRILGVDWTIGGIGGYASRPNRMIFSGNPTVGEEYRHEFAHVVLGPLVPATGTHHVVEEGAATWLGGSLGHDHPALMREYAAFLHARPAVTLDSVLFGAGDPELGRNPAGAALVEMAHQRGGVAAVTTLLGIGRSDAELRATLERVLGEPWPAIAQRWRAHVLAFRADEAR